MRISRSSHHSVTGHHNHVDINRIRDGIDVRTTIMLRNIPNKVDQSMLKRIIDESSWGKYDFMYLRIDFANDCNVGYAFINFVDMFVISAYTRTKKSKLTIEQFVDARGNQRCFTSLATVLCLISQVRKNHSQTLTISLFTPNAGQHFRDEQRRRRSQYDRGTRLAALEEYDYEAAMQHLYGTTK
ncbi:hypothetical protein CDD80_4716 [Ophiocordyceps camponoti-rufipedis]|uniref:Mei2-like C-terminal RNA recognition motif domain-containing protein n=1 Tax=Ophiocordyceps camponoti-rufipedis TaxID=2004952 RepID=A0A2C5YTT2_9HYPO|nr:hypothetical protein CDD80_4716 [Ophiocordyceps camponoti-rufipedis]